jgi:hypothetical protein
MKQPKPKSKRILEVHVSFEVSRLSPEYLAQAYEQVLPPVRRVTARAKPTPVIDINVIEKNTGETNHEQA